MEISVSVSVADMSVQIYPYRYRQRYRLGEYIGIGIGWTHIGQTLAGTAAVRCRNIFGQKNVIVSISSQSSTFSEVFIF
jgi:hypothetical protein